MTGEKRKKASRVLAFTALAVMTLLFLRHLWIKGLLDAWLPPSTAGVNITRTLSGRGDDACQDCHGEVEDLHLRGPHRTIGCVDCHDGTGGHVRDGEMVAATLPFKSVTRLCSRCHRELADRRRDAPALNLEAHVIEVGALFSDRVCFDCHRPHDPRP